MPQFPYRADVDGLRAVAVVLVLLFHAQWGFRGGYVGVDVFFVISGYLITGLILKEQQAGTFRLVNFWGRRVRRIVPAMSVVIGSSLIAGYFLLFPADYVELAQSAAAQQVMLGNVFFWRITDYFAGPAELKPLLHTWSLAVEEQFYLAYPLLLMGLCRWRPRRAAAVLAIVAVVSLTISEWGVRNHPVATFFLSPPRAWELLLGGLLCYVPAIPADRRWQAEGLGVAGILAILWAGISLDANTRFPGLWALIPCLGTAAVIYSGTDRTTWTGRLLSLKPVVFVGLISYSLYLWHWPLLAFTRYWLGGDLPPGVTAVALLVSLGLAVLSWRFVELPLRRGIPTEYRRVVTAAILGTVPLLLAGGIAIVAFQGFPARIPPQALEYQGVTIDENLFPSTTPQEVQQQELPTFGAENGRRTCLVWGDSHARVLMPGLDAAAVSRDIGGYQATHPFTAPLLDYVWVVPLGLSQQAPEFNRNVLNFALERELDLVILAGVWHAYAESPNFEAHLDQTIRSLHAEGIEIAIVLDVAYHDDEVPLALARRAYLGRPTDDLGVPDADHQARNAKANEIIRRVAQERAIVLDPAPYLVDEHGLWRAELGGKAMYIDRSHLSVEGSLRLRPLFESLFDAVLRKDPGD